MITVPMTERDLEELVVRQMVDVGWKQGVRSGEDGLAVVPPESQATMAYRVDQAVDVEQLGAFLRATQPEVATAVGFGDGAALDIPRLRFLTRLQNEIGKRGVVDVLRSGIGHQAHQVRFFFPTPTPGNPKAAEAFAANRWVVARQVHFSERDGNDSVDLVAFVNGLPVLTMELKNSITGQGVEHAVRQYKAHRSPRELLFAPKRALVHFAVDDKEVQFCAALAGAKSWFLPFNKGHNHGAGNPVNPDGLRTDYLWREVLAPSSLANIIENYAQVTRVKDAKTQKATEKVIFPRYHQLDAVRKLLADVAAKGIGQRYLIEHSAGSGKSNSIAWLSHQLIEVDHAGTPVVDTVLVVTDRVILDNQIKDTIKAFTQVGSTVAHAEDSAGLRAALEAGKRIVITTVQKFPFIVKSIGSEHRTRKFAVIIDEAHSSQTGKAAAALATALSDALEATGAVGEDDTVEDVLARAAEQRKLPTNASYFAFTATPKNKTLEMFGTRRVTPLYGAMPGVDAPTDREPFHLYSMKQAIEEGFILDVLKGYIQVDSYYKLVKTVEDDPEFDARKAAKKLRTYVEGHEEAIREKAQIMVDHFHNQVFLKRKINGQARAMVVASSIERAIAYYREICAHLTEHGAPYGALVAFSDKEIDGEKYTESQFNGFPSKDIPERFRDTSGAVGDYRILVVASKFQTGYDEPLLHTMYVDKPLSSVLAVQTLSRLNRAAPGKSDTCVVDFANKPEQVRGAFERYYRMTTLAGETDVDKLHDLAGDLAAAGVYSGDDVDRFVSLIVAGAERAQLDPILDACAQTYSDHLSADDQVVFKGNAKAFVRAYSFLSLIMPFNSVPWEKLSIFLAPLIAKLPTPLDDDLSEGVLESIDMDSYRVEKREEMRIVLADTDAALDPVPTGGGGGLPGAEMERLSTILVEFNDLFGNIPWVDADRVRERIVKEIPEKVAADQDYINAKRNNDEANARLAMEKALKGVLVGMLSDETELYKQFADNQEFRRWITGAVFRATYDDGASA